MHRDRLCAQLFLPVPTESLARCVGGESQLALRARERDHFHVFRVDDFFRRDDFQSQRVGYVWCVCGLFDLFNGTLHVEVALSMRPPSRSAKILRTASSPLIFNPLQLPLVK